MNKRILLTGLLFFISFQIFGQIKEDKSYMIIATHSNKALEIKPAADLNANRLQLQQNDSTEILPGKGLAQHDFLYAGESGNRRVYIIKDGKVVWFYDDPSGKGEVSDAVMLSNGNVLIAHQFAINLISPEKKILWNYNAPDGTEIHTAMPIGTDNVLFVQNGDPAMVKVVNITTGEIKKQFQIPVANPKSTHGQFRHARITPAGTLLLSHMDMNKVCEYNSDGKEIWSFPADVPWGANPLKNGNVLIVDRQGIREVNHRGETVAQFSRNDAGKYKLGSLQLAWRLPNGNTLINNWENEWNGPIDKTKNSPIQAVELTPDKKVVWVLKSWKEPDLGPATTIQILDEPTAPENVIFGDIK
jgi:outer membrane protein assembly factor BamB